MHPSCSCIGTRPEFGGFKFDQEDGSPLKLVANWFYWSLITEEFDEDVRNKVMEMHDSKGALLLANSLNEEGN